MKAFLLNKKIVKKLIAFTIASFFPLLLFSQSYQVGQKIGDGIVIYLDFTGKHGILGYNKTIWITTNRAVGDWNEAVNVCSHLDEGWRLPSKDELNLFRLEKKSFAKYFDEKFDKNGNRIYGDDSVYWSSTQSSSNSAFAVDFSDGETTSFDKHFQMGVRAVKSF
jgi:hypothetical protein